MNEDRDIDSRLIDFWLEETEEDVVADIGKRFKKIKDAQENLDRIQRLKDLGLLDSFNNAD